MTQWQTWTFYHRSFGLEWQTTAAQIMTNWSLQKVEKGKTAATVCFFVASMWWKKIIASKNKKSKRLLIKLEIQQGDNQDAFNDHLLCQVMTDVNQNCSRKAERLTRKAIKTSPLLRWPFQHRGWSWSGTLQAPWTRRTWAQRGQCRPCLRKTRSARVSNHKLSKENATNQHTLRPEAPTYPGDGVSELVGAGVGVDDVDHRRGYVTQRCGSEVYDLEKDKPWRDSRLHDVIVKNWQSISRWWSSPGPVLSRCNRCSCTGPHTSEAPRHGVWVDCSFLPDTPCAWEFSRNATEISLLTNNALVRTSKFNL